MGNELLQLCPIECGLEVGEVTGDRRFGQFSTARLCVTLSYPGDERRQALFVDVPEPLRADLFLEAVQNGRDFFGRAHCQPGDDLGFIPFAKFLPAELRRNDRFAGVQFGLQFASQPLSIFPVTCQAAAADSGAFSSESAGDRIPPLELEVRAVAKLNHVDLDLSILCHTSHPLAAAAFWRAS